MTNEDYAGMLCEFAGGARGTFEASRTIVGPESQMAFDAYGTRGAVGWNLERMNELQVYFEDDPAGLQGFRTINVTEGVHPYTAHWWPAGHIIGYEHTFTHAIADLLDGIGKGVNPGPTFAEGFAVQAVLDAVERSVATHDWAAPEKP